MNSVVMSPIRVEYSSFAPYQTVNEVSYDSWLSTNPFKTHVCFPYFMLIILVVLPFAL